MIAVDTNILARAILADDPDQTKSARILLAEHAKGEGVFIPAFALLELLWLLRAKGKLTRLQIHETVQTLLESEGVVIGNHSLVIKALELFGRASVGFEDCLILAESQAAGCDELHTFDKDLAATFPENVRKVE